MSTSIQDLYIAGKSDAFFVPDVSLKAKERIGTIRGESYLEDTFEFYERIEVWIDTFFKAGNQAFTLIFQLNYHNTSSSRAILGLILKLKKLAEIGNDIKIIWRYPMPDDNEVLEDGKDFATDADFPIEFVEVSEANF